MDTLITIGLWLLLVTLCCGCVWAIYYGIRAKVRYYKSLAAEARAYLKKDKQ